MIFAPNCSDKASSKNYEQCNFQVDFQNLNLSRAFLLSFILLQVAPRGLDSLSGKLMFINMEANTITFIVSLTA